MYYTESIIYFKGLGNNRYLPFKFVQDKTIFKNVLICGDANVPGTSFKVGSQHFPMGRSALVDHFLYGWRPFIKLISPIRKGGQRHNY